MKPVTVRVEDVEKRMAEGFTCGEALRLNGVRRVGETAEEHGRAWSRITTKHAMSGLGAARAEA